MTPDNFRIHIQPFALTVHGDKLLLCDILNALPNPTGRKKGPEANGGREPSRIAAKSETGRDPPTRIPPRREEGERRGNVVEMDYPREETRERGGELAPKTEGGETDATDRRARQLSYAHTHTLTLSV